MTAYDDALAAHNPVRVWKLDTAGSVVDDVSSTSATVIGATHQAAGPTAELPGSYLFDGVDDWINTNITTSDAALGNEWTKIVWGRLDSAVEAVPVSNRDGSAGWAIVRRSSALMRYTLFGVRDITGSSTIPTGTWHQFVVTGSTSGDDIILYWNGAFETNRGVYQTEVASTVPLKIGQRDSGVWWHGPISRVAILNKALTATEVADLYAAAFEAGGGAQNINLGTALETGQAYALTVANPRSYLVGTALEADQTYAALTSNPRSYLLGTATEANDANLLTVGLDQTVQLGTATEADAANSLSIEIESLPVPSGVTVTVDGTSLIFDNYEVVG